MEGTNILAFVTGRSTGDNDMNVANGILAVMYHTISYHTYSSIDNIIGAILPAYATTNRGGGRGI